ncbi:NAD-dependent epimerase/dehydratase family protein [Alicyclobacillus fodiniaquatilis]|uniref:NAD-dependent epimerase/dehydratase family protein n=1 Tax=Alicyclobacillus fodiniaquatilis TaxID=1661150 RepID=A0ABW4JAW1_9BACL
MNILVIGGTRFFGRRLVHKLLQHGHAVTIASRGNTADDFGDAVKRVRVDRADDAAMLAAFAEQSYDVVFDQVGFTPQHAKGAVAAFAGRVKRYIFTSTMAVYEGKEALTTEADFDPFTHTVDLDAKAYDYGEGKRQAEAYLFQHAPFPVVAARVAMVVSGDDDYTGRFAFHVQHVAEGTSIGVLAEEHPISYVTAWDVADLLYFLGVESDFVGPINAANDGFYSTQSLCRQIGSLVGKTPLFHVAENPDEDALFSPYAFPVTLKVKNDLARRIGFSFPDWTDRLPQMVAEVMGAPKRDH